ncbi:hypothetical protein [Tateyamaria pelophila]|uniref:hypothetical protein n=1 Tax=Tateyamaria pelophila TaxID=328415 RepID=UPI001CBA7D98|nr:hypothetical protein [Tateyamaria pelophila]
MSAAEVGDSVYGEDLTVDRQEAVPAAIKDSSDPRQAATWLVALETPHLGTSRASIAVSARRA